MKKRAFTLTELLVVVVIIGVLSAVVLPKFTKVLQTRKTTEAENVMAAVRNEQEARCMVGRNYVGQNEIGKLASLPKATSKNYTYTLGAQGITATAKDGNYTLQIPSYTDGRICCSGEGCEKLNKDYPACNDTFLAAIDQSACEAPEVTENPEPEPEPACNLSDYTRTCQEEGYGTEYTGSVTYTVNADCTGHTKTDTCTKAAPALVCTPGEKKEQNRPSCGPKTWKECKADGSAWENKTDSTLTAEEIANCSCDTKQETEKACDDGGGSQTRTETCDTSTGKWKYGEWDTSACTDEQMESCADYGGICEMILGQFYILDSSKEFSMTKAEKLAEEDGSNSLAYEYITNVCCAVDESKHYFKPTKSSDFVAILSGNSVGTVYYGLGWNGDGCSLIPEGTKVQSCSSYHDMRYLCSRCDPSADTCNVACYDNDSLYQAQDNLHDTIHYGGYGCTVVQSSMPRAAATFYVTYEGGPSCHGQVVGYTQNGGAGCGQGYSYQEVSDYLEPCSTCSGLAYRQRVGVFCYGPGTSGSHSSGSAEVCMHPAWKQISGYTCTKED